MEILQWSMRIPSSQQVKFEKFYETTMVPTWTQFGAVKCELLKIFKEKRSREEVVVTDRYIERLYLRDGLTCEDFFKEVRNDDKAWQTSRKYEKTFGAHDITLSYLKKCI